MKMHSHRFKDPMISQAQPITILSPIIEETLRSAGVRPDREMVLERFMGGQPRIAIVHGSEDHSPNVGSREVVRRLIRQLWAESALPFEVFQAPPCEQLSQGSSGSHYAFLARNACAATLATLMEAHGYDAAIVLGACDMMLVGSLRALVEVDVARQRRKARPVYAAFLPSNVGPSIYLSPVERRRFDEIRDRLPVAEARELFELLDLPLSPSVYDRVKSVLDRCFNQRSILEAEKDDLEHVVASLASSTSAASSEASVISRLIIATFGFVPRHMDLSLRPASDEQLAHLVRRLTHGIQKRERRISASQLTKANMQNAITVWNATGGHPSWLLHLQYLAGALGVQLNPTVLSRKMAKVPQLLTFDPGLGGSAHGMAAEADAGRNSGIDTIMRTLTEKRLVDDRAATLEGTWMQRIMDARSANGNFLHSTMTPISPSSGLARVQGNLCSTALVRLGSVNNGVDRYDKKIYLADYYLGQNEFIKEAGKPDGLLGRLKKKLTRDDLYRTWSINWKLKALTNDDPAEWTKSRLWNFMVDEDLIRVMVFVVGEGPRASGMPEIRFPADIIDPTLGRSCVLATDGRIAFGHERLSIAHIVPEAIAGEGLAAVQRGDWIYLDLRRGEFQIVTHARKPEGFRVLSAGELARRTDNRKRVVELERRRSQFLPSVRAALNSVGDAAAGVSPLSS
jgi:dihydroxyacid dehydratase/phosphogluconate dehydratase